MELIGGGRASQVFALDERSVLRRSGFDVSGEARLMRHLREVGFPVPEVFAVEGADLTMQRLHGGTLAEAFTAGRIGVAEAAGVLLELHDRLHAIDAPDWLPGTARGLDLGGEGMPKVLHLDLHPENVIVTDEGPWLVDWTNAAAGAPEVDLAVSWAILEGIDPVRVGPESEAEPGAGPEAEPMAAEPAAGPESMASVLAELAAVFADRASREARALAVEYREADPNVDAAEARRLRAALGER